MGEASSSDEVYLVMLSSALQPGVAIRRESMERVLTLL